MLPAPELARIGEGQVALVIKAQAGADVGALVRAGHQLQPPRHAKMHDDVRAVEGNI